MSIYFIGGIVLLGIALTISIKAYIGKCKENSALKDVVKETSEALATRDKLSAEKEAIRSETEAKKNMLNTGDDDTNFNNSIELLNGLSTKKRTS